MEKEITELIEGCIQFFRTNRYAETSIYRHKSVWNRGILRYMKERGITMYSPQLGQLFIRDCYPESDYRPTARDMSLSIRTLDDYLTSGSIRNKRVIVRTYSLNGDIGVQMQKLINHLQSKRRDSITVKSYQRNLHRFLGYLTNAGVITIDEISERHILQFISTIENHKENIVSYLRVLFRFWYENNISSENLVGILDSYRWRRKEKIPSFYSDDEVRTMETSVDRTGPAGKRSYAMLLLATRLGLRASDIAKLQFSNIDWSGNEISLTQYKTGNPIKLPLLSDVGNAIIDYLKYGRQNSSSPYIFLAHKPPYDSITSSIVSDAIRKVIKESDISADGRRQGPHSMRHSLASSLMKYGTPMPIISEVLGHESTDTTMTYLTIDVTSLLKCALPVSAVSDDFYQQKGGFFYE